MQVKKTKKSKVLHITNWYPNPWHAHEGIFIKNQFDAFSKVTDSTIVNIQSRKSDRLFSVTHERYSEKEEAYFILSSLPWQSAHEIFTTLLLIWVLIRKRVNSFDLVHFHIAYPLLTHYWLWNRLLRIPAVISEHWSAYHYNFYLPASSQKLERIKSIFKSRLPLITVSKSLLTDIRNFSGAEDFKSDILPNIIEESFLKFDVGKQTSSEPIFLTVNVWRDIKNPFPMLEAFERLSSTGVRFKLLIGGYGPLIDRMTDFVNSSSLAEHTQFLGKLTNSEILEHLRNSDAYLFSSEYETFSVACAQALCTGTPLIGPHIDAIAEYASSQDWKTVRINQPSEWQTALNEFMQNRSCYISKEISDRARSRFTTDLITKDYLEIIDRLIHERLP